MPSLDANRAATALLNVSVRRLRDRLLLHFAEDRDGFSNVLAHLQRHEGDVRVTLAVRPRERSRPCGYRDRARILGGSTRVAVVLAADE